MTVLGEYGDSYAAFLLERIQRINDREEDHATDRYEDHPHVFTLTRNLPDDLWVTLCRCGWSSGSVGSRTTATRLAEEHDREASA